MCTSYVICLSSKLVSISDCIKSKLVISTLILTGHHISQPLSCKLTSCSSPITTEIRNLIMTANSISPINPLTLIVFKNLVHTLTYSILDFISKSLDDGIMGKSLAYTIIKPILKNTSLDADVLTNYRTNPNFRVSVRLWNVF